MAASAPIVYREALLVRAQPCQGSPPGCCQALVALSRACLGSGPLAGSLPGCSQ